MTDASRCSPRRQSYTPTESEVLLLVSQTKSDNPFFGMKNLVVAVQEARADWEITAKEVEDACLILEKELAEMEERENQRSIRRRALWKKGAAGSPTVASVANAVVALQKVATQEVEPEPAPEQPAPEPAPELQSKLGPEIPLKTATPPQTVAAGTYLLQQPAVVQHLMSATADAIANTRKTVLEIQKARSPRQPPRQSPASAAEPHVESRSSQAAASFGVSDTVTPTPHSAAVHLCTVGI
jgi:hypothetical protein